MHKRVFSRRSRAVLISVAVLIPLLLAGLVTYIIFDSRRPHTAADFGFHDAVAQTDADGDGIDDFADMVAGAREYIATEPTYASKYYRGGYPDDGNGVCTDVIWHALAAAGYSLKDFVDADIAAAPSAYFTGDEAADPNIDFRRVRNLLVFLRRHAVNLTTSTANPRDWMPGDIVIYDGHIAICSDKRSMWGLPYIIHHGNDVAGAVEANEILYSSIIGHFRIDASLLGQ